MLQNYLSIALRNLQKNRLFSLLNLLGLAFGISCSLLILLWVNDEMGYDQFHEKRDRLYKIRENQFYSDGNIFTFLSTPGPMAPFIKEKFPEIERATRQTWTVSNVFQSGDKSFFEEGLYVDPDFLQMFSFPFISGDPNTALDKTQSVVLTRKMAEKYFGDENPVGQLMVMNSTESFEVTGVMENVPANSSIEFDYLLPFQGFWEANMRWLDRWGNNNIRTNILLTEGTDPAVFAEKLRYEIKEHVPESNTELIIQPFADAYLYGKWEEGKLTGGRIEYVRIFFIVAIFILVIASINFMNLSTAQAARRAKEVGLRKVVGAVPWQLLLQFIGESMLITVLSSAIALAVVTLLMPYYNVLTGKELSFDLLNRETILMFSLVVLGTGLLAGSYPALFISRFQPSKVLKGQLDTGRSAAGFRKALVVTQFSLSIFLIICTTVVYRQMEFTMDRDIGMDREDVFFMRMRGEMFSKLETVRNELLADPSIKDVSAASQLPIDVHNSTGNVQWEGKDPDTEILFSEVAVDYEFFQTMKMTLLEGRSFDRNIIADSSNFIVNEVAASKFGFEGPIAGREIEMWGKKGIIVGVVKNFNFGSLHSKIEPLIMHLGIQNANLLLVKAASGRVTEAIAGLEQVAKKYSPAYPFRYEFLSKEWEAMYQAEARMGQLFNGFALLSIFISCLGLFGLSAYAAQRRTKELGLRKVMGASVSGLVRLVSKEFALLILVASLIGCPLGWYFMNQWLAGYAFHVDVGYGTLLIAALICLVVSMITVGYHSLKASMVNPAQSLRYE